MSEAPGLDTPFRYGFQYMEQLAATGWRFGDLVEHERLEGLKVFTDFVDVARDMRAAADVKLSRDQLRDHKIRPVADMPPHGLLDELGEIVDRYADNATCCRDQLEALDLDWVSAYKAVELLALGMPEDDLRRLFEEDAPKQAIAAAFDAEFRAMEAFAAAHKLRISEITPPAFAQLAQDAHPDLALAVYDWSDPKVVAARKRGGSSTPHAAAASAAQDPQLKAPPRGRKRAQSSAGAAGGSKRKKAR